MAASEVEITTAQAAAIAKEWGRRKKNAVVVRQESGERDIQVWLPNYSGTKQRLVRIQANGKVTKGALSRTQKAAVKQSKR